MKNDRLSSQRAIQANSLKMKPPQYVTQANLATIRAQNARGKAQGRNESCACGSGKKYKHCHGKLVVESSCPRKDQE